MDCGSGLRDVVGVDAVGGERRVTLGVRFRAEVEQIADAARGVGAREVRAGRDVADPPQDLVGRGGERDDDGAIERAVTDLAREKGPAAERDHARRAVGEKALEDLVLALPELGLAVASPDRRHRGAGVLRDELVGVDEREPESRGDEGPDGALACAHEAVQKKGFHQNASICR